MSFTFSKIRRTFFLFFLNFIICNTTYKKIQYTTLLTLLALITTKHCITFLFFFCTHRTRRTTYYICTLGMPNLVILHTLFFCRGRQRNVQRFIAHVQNHYSSHSRGSTPRKIGWGCAARFPKPLPYFRPW